MGGLAISMIGIISLAPVMCQLIMPVLSSLSKLTGADPSVFTSSILAVDMGGYATSIEIAKNQNIAQFTGLILASMMGATISFTIPIAINMISKEDFPYFAKGILAGIVTIPIGMLVGGTVMENRIQGYIVKSNSCNISIDNNSHRTFEIPKEDDLHIYRIR